MGIFTLDKRLLGICTLAISFHVLVIGIHGTVDVGKFVSVCLFVLYGTAGIFILDPTVASFKIRSETGFVTQ